MWLKIIKPIDSFIDSISMYRLLLYYLLVLLAAAITQSLIGNFKLSAIGIAESAVILTSACYIFNKLFSTVFNAPTNPESPLLSGLILSLIIPPSFSNHGLIFMLMAAIVAMASKYVLVYKNSHIFNPVALAVTLTAIGAKQNADWWVGTASLLPVVILGGLLIMRKVRRGTLIISFLVATTAATSIYALLGHATILPTLKNMVLSSPIFFFAFVMLCEPYTSPTVKSKQISYSVLVGLLIPPQFHIGSYYTSPEVALIAGNIFAFIISNRIKVFPHLLSKTKIANKTLEYAFASNSQIPYKPGQYMEWTLPHHHTDSRGVRRYFTLVSSPTENELKIGVKFSGNGSSYKKALLDLNSSSKLVAGSLGGDFTLPRDQSVKLVFIAGGIGITPFRSMIKYLLDQGEKRDVILIYSANIESDLAYLKDIFEAKKKIGLKCTFVLTDTANCKLDNLVKSKYINEDVINQVVGDINSRTFYISGSHPMVSSVESSLRNLGVGYQNIKVDFFPGYA